MPNPVGLAYDSKDGYVNAVCSETGGEEARDALKEGGMQQEEVSDGTRVVL
jgi:hypothetical protein